MRRFFRMCQQHPEQAQLQDEQQELCRFVTQWGFSTSHKWFFFSHWWSFAVLIYCQVSSKFPCLQFGIGLMSMASKQFRVRKPCSSAISTLLSMTWSVTIFQDFGYGKMAPLHVGQTKTNKNYELSSNKYYRTRKMGSFKLKTFVANVHFGDIFVVFEVRQRTCQSSRWTKVESREFQSKSSLNYFCRWLDRNRLLDFFRWFKRFLLPTFKVNGLFPFADLALNRSVWLMCANSFSIGTKLCVSRVRMTHNASFHLLFVRVSGSHRLFQMCVPGWKQSSMWGPVPQQLYCRHFGIAVHGRQERKKRLISCHRLSQTVRCLW